MNENTSKDDSFKQKIHLKHWCIHLNKSKYGIFCNYWFHTKIDFQFDCKNCTDIQFEF